MFLFRKIEAYALTAMRSFQFKPLFKVKQTQFQNNICR